MGESTSTNEHGCVPIKQQKQPVGHSGLTPETKDLKFEIWFFPQLYILKEKKSTENGKNGTVNKVCLFKK